MTCWRFDIRRDLFKYVDEALTLPACERIERHLMDCADCRDQVERLRNAQDLIAELPLQTPEDERWIAIRRAVRSSPSQPVAAPIPSLFAKPFRFAAVGMLALGTVGLVTLVTFNSLNRESFTSRLTAFTSEQPREFTPVPISRVGEVSAPHIVTEGYVVDMKIDEDDGDYTFKLVDDKNDPNHFVVCEIIEPITIARPQPGSKVRVYGVSRFDNKPNHKWQEVHPVLGIETVHP
jgi:hypothetical protein